MDRSLGLAWAVACALALALMFMALQGRVPALVRALALQFLLRFNGEMLESFGMHCSHSSARPEPMISNVFELAEVLRTRFLGLDG